MVKSCALGEFGATLTLVARKPAEVGEAVAQLAEKEVAAMGFPADLGGPTPPPT